MADQLKPLAYVTDVEEGRTLFLPRWSLDCAGMIPLVRQDEALAALAQLKGRVEAMEDGERRAIRAENRFAELRLMIANDSYAMTFQTLGQYRSAIIKLIDAAIDRARTSAETKE